MLAIKKQKTSYINIKLPPQHTQMLSVIANDDLRTRPSTILVLIQQEFQRRYPGQQLGEENASEIEN